MFRAAYSDFLAAGVAVPSFKFQFASLGGHQIVGATPVGTPAALCDVFQLGVMAGGWDAVAVAAKGLPASGVVPITLTVSDVGHMQHVLAPA
jgi:hypothetical protein